VIPQVQGAGVFVAAAARLLVPSLPFSLFFPCWPWKCSSLFRLFSRSRASEKPFTLLRSSASFFEQSFFGLFYCRMRTAPFSELVVVGRCLKFFLFVSWDRPLWASFHTSPDFCFCTPIPFGQLSIGPKGFFLPNSLSFRGPLPQSVYVCAKCCLRVTLPYYVSPA